MWFHKILIYCISNLKCTHLPLVLTNSGVPFSLPAAFASNSSRFRSSPSRPPGLVEFMVLLHLLLLHPDCVHGHARVHGYKHGWLRSWFYSCLSGYRGSHIRTDVSLIMAFRDIITCHFRIADFVIRGTAEWIS